MDYQSVRFDIKPCDENITDLLAAFLADAGFESFEPDETGMTAYIQAGNYDEKAVEDAVGALPFDSEISFNATFVKGVDWNEEWEKNYFKPIRIGNRCVVRSSFHTDVEPADYEIIIDPKMAFGTGHHSTTSLMLGYILELPLEGKRVIDMGTGTGILAILAMKRGAASATGIEIDPGAYENSLDNGRLNGVEVEFKCGDASLLKNEDKADLFIANINRNVITGDIARYSDALKPGGTMLLSGFYTEDIPIVADAARAAGLELIETRSDNNWAGLRLSKVFPQYTPLVSQKKAIEVLQ